jgi:hypothetical protein
MSKGSGKEKGRLGSGAREEKGEFEWETLNPCIGTARQNFSQFVKKSPAKAGLEKGDVKQRCVLS